MKKIWILGGGKFGTRAATVLRKKYTDSSITIVEKDPDVITHAQLKAFNVICDDAIEFLMTGLVESANGPDWIIPAIPIHVAFEWIRKRLSSWHPKTIPVPDEIPDATQSFTG